MTNSLCRKRKLADSFISYVDASNTLYSPIGKRSEAILVNPSFLIPFEFFIYISVFKHLWLKYHHTNRFIYKTKLVRRHTIKSLDSSVTFVYIFMYKLQIFQHGTNIFV